MMQAKSEMYASTDARNRFVPRGLANTHSASRISSWPPGSARS